MLATWMFFWWDVTAAGEPVLVFTARTRLFVFEARS